MVTRLHILLTYNCSLRCKHCYVFSDQRAPGKISLSQISQILNDGSKIPSVRWIYFGGGEPFTQYPLLLKAVQRARKLGYEVGVETNGYFARSIDTGIRFLRPLTLMGIRNIRISNDSLHYKNPDTSPASRAIKAAQELGVPTTIVRVSYPDLNKSAFSLNEEFTSMVEPRLMYSGRAAEMMVEGRQSFRSEHFKKCPRNDLASPEELFIDAYGFVQICPGIAIGNIHSEPLNQIVDNYNIHEHKITQSLEVRGPSGLILDHNLKSLQCYVDACHCCFSTRKGLIEIYPELIGPRQVYGF